MQQRLITALTLTTAILAGAGCGTATTDTSASTDAAGGPASDVVEVDHPEHRLAITHADGVLVVDAESGEVLADHPFDETVRVNPAGDGRHVLLSGSDGFRALDLGTWTEAHGDHGHSWTTDPALTEVTFPAETPGHVVPHHGRTTLFDDGTGAITSFDPDDLAEDRTALPSTRAWESEDAHHGVAVEREDGNLLRTLGTDEARTGVVLTTGAGHELARSEECPGVHGEAFAAEVAGFGCEDGVLLADGRAFTKVASPDGGRTGTLAGHHDSPHLLGDHRTDPDADLEQVALVDTRDASMRVLDLPASYTSSSLGRGPGGEALVLGTDGSLRVIDPETATVSTEIEVLAPWTAPSDWQQPRPVLVVAGGTAYVTDPGTSTLHVVDLGDGEVTASHALPHVPHEVAASHS